MNRTNTLRFAIVGLLLTGFGCGKGSKDHEVTDAEVEDGSVDDGDGGRKDGGGNDGGRNDGGGGGGDGGGGCLTACADDDCGEVPNGCGDFVTCGTCDTGYVCGLNTPNKCGVPPPPPCTPLDPTVACVDKCGAVSDNCSGVIICNADNGGTTCGANQTCMGSTCVETGVSCMAQTCDDKNHDCGQDGDGCGGTIDCGTCGAGDRCAYKSTGNECELIPPPSCTPRNQVDACLDSCGIVGDNCGGTIDCEASPLTACPVGETCGGGGVSGECGNGSTACIPTPAAVACAGKCGIQPDGCGGTWTCNLANGGQVCNSNAGESCGGGGVPNVCGAVPCTPRTQAEACPATGVNKSCGLQPDGCGAMIDCGGCAANQQCGLTTASICGTIPSCMPIVVTTACSGKCGTVSDGCAGSYVCNNTNGGVTCTGNEYCGANNMPNKCAAPPVTCVPKTCATLGHSCGLASDGCGHVLNCWPSCAENDPNCTSSCGSSASCLANQTSGSQTCVSGGPTCVGPLCNAVPTSCATNAPTRLTGTVRTPGVISGATTINQLPVPNAMVYIPADPAPELPSIFQGVQAGNPASCGRCDDEKLVADGQSVLAAAVTDYKGDFTLEGRVPVGSAFELVIKVGKWRRVVQVPANVATACQSKPLDIQYTKLSASSTDGLSGTHLPQIAVSTGNVDAMECVLLGMGISQSEFTVPSGTGRIHMYRANGTRMQRCDGTYTLTGTTYQCSANNNAGCVNGRSGCTWNDASVADTTIYASQAAINAYDMVVFDCEGTGHKVRAATPLSYLLGYANNGGRVFASHWSYEWLDNNGSLDMGSAWWNGGNDGDSSATGYVSLPAGNTARTGANAVKSLLYRDWLDYQGSLTGSTAGQLSNPTTPQMPITDPRNVAGATVGASTDEWMYRDVRTCTSSTRTCTDDSGCRVCSNDASRYCTANTGCRNGGTCKAAVAGSCTHNPYVQQLSFNTPYNAAETAICGRVAFSAFHVASASGGTTLATGNLNFPAECRGGALTAQEKTLAFMLFDLATCVSAGAPPQPPACVPKTVTDVCPSANDACGYVSDGCGGVVDCAGCASGNYCDGNTCRPQECTPSTCASLGFNCGNYADGCGGIARNAQGAEGCGTCSGGQTCGLTTPGICGGCVQIPYATACPTNSCGQVSNGCGGTHDCGVCPSGVCGGGGANRCGAGTCTPIAFADACQQRNCGVVADGCGGTHNCGTCTAPDTCGGTGIPNVCGHATCTPKTKDQACVGFECGWTSDGCGGSIHCADCPSNGVCGGNGPNKCGRGCDPTTCTAAGAECGAIADQCGGLLNCGNCPSGQTCGANAPNKCGTGAACTPRTCLAAGAECGLVGDGCGGVLDCGTCTAPETCGGDGHANQCGVGTGGCSKISCDDPRVNVECGAATDGCGGLQDCGTCPAGYTCKSGVCEEIII